jgi:dTDP-4-dehydrorhamnose reductase
MGTVLLVGSSGQLAFDLKRCWPEERPEDELIALTHAELEVTDLQAVTDAVSKHRPSLILNTSAYHRVDEVEDQPERAFLVNAVGPRHLALAGREIGATLVHISTDYVFSGRQRRPYLEDDPVGPPNVYGASKAAGEMLVRSTWERHFIVSSCGLFGVVGSAGKGGNFVETMLRLAAAGQKIRIVDDQVLTPTYTAPLAVQIARLVGTEAFGTYHATCQGECSWYEFAREVFSQAGLAPGLEAQSSAELNSGARRPEYSVLQNARLQAMGIDLMPPWQEALAGYMKARTEHATYQSAGGPA